MFAQIRHMAIVTSNANHEGDFYRDIFGMKRSGLPRAGGAVVVGDGYVGLSRLRPAQRKVSQDRRAQAAEQPPLRRNQHA
jgi:catechol 2,3-dioxygenase-like lactoylglutathione lyase family enzyme